MYDAGKEEGTGASKKEVKRHNKNVHLTGGSVAGAVARRGRV